MRQIVLDTETTGLDPVLGHRIIEIAAVELVNRRPTNKYFHRYVNPERDSEEAALQIHGLTREFLSDKPKFREIADEFLQFITGAELIIHNAAFDVAFLNYELTLLDLKPISSCCAGVLDTLRIARDTHPGKRNALVRSPRCRYRAANWRSLSFRQAPMSFLHMRNISPRLPTRAAEHASGVSCKAE